MNLQCPHCRKPVTLPELPVGATAPCPACGQPMGTPVLSAPSPRFSSPGPAIPAGRGKAGAGLGLGGLVIVLIAGRVLFAGYGSASKAKSREAVTMNDEIINATNSAHLSCTNFTDALEKWAETGKPADVPMLKDLQRMSSEAASNTSQRMTGMAPAGSQEGRDFQAAAKRLAALYVEIADRAFPRILEAVGAGGVLEPEVAQRIVAIENEFDEKLKRATAELEAAQQVFASKQGIKLLPNPGR